jgi:MFS family permease
VRGIPLGTAGLVLSASSVAGLVAGPVCGSLIDRVGPRAVLAGSVIVSAVGFGGFALVRDTPGALLAAVLAGLGSGAFWPSHASTVATLVSRESRHNAYATQRALNNLGIGVGGVIGGLIATTTHPRSYELLFVIDAVTFLGYLAALAFVRVPARAVEAVEAAERTTRVGYRFVVRHKTFIAYVVMNAALVAVGFALLGDIFPAFAKNSAHVTERAIGFCFLANTLAVVIVQLPTAKWLEGKRRMAAYTVEGVIWAVAWVMVFVGGWWFAGAHAAIVFAVALTIFGVGECFHGTVQNALIADLARPDLLGRYLALNGFGFQLGGAAARACGGFALAFAPNGLWLVAAGLALAVGFSALLLERVLPERMRRTPIAVAA